MDLDKQQLIELGLKKKNGEIDKTWEQLGNEHGVSGEYLRDLVKKFQRKQGTLPQKPKDNHIINELEMKKIELKKEKVKLQDQKTAFNKLIRDVSRNENIIDEIKSAIKESNLQELKSITVSNKDSKKEMLSLWSDFHYGATANNYFNQYDKKIFKQRFEKYISKIIEIGVTQGINKLHIFMLGDLISGIIHTNLRVSNTENVVKQTQEVSELMCLALYELSKVFGNIQVYYTIGNHGRVFACKNEAIDNENFEEFIYWYMKARLNNLSSVKINENMIDDIIFTNICGYKVAGVHGDKDSSNNVVSNVSLLMKEVPDYIAIGHKHHYYEDVIQGVNVIGSGSILATDEFSKSIRKIGYACQTVCIFNQEGKECSYNVVLN